MSPPSTHPKLPAGADPPWTTPNGITATYDLHCHCGSIRLTMTLSPPLLASQTEGKEQATAIVCTCSYCTRNAFWSVHPLAKDVVFTHGLEDRAEYLTGAKQMPWWFCRKCGSVLGCGMKALCERLGVEERVAVNVHMLRNFDAETIKVRTLDMAKEFPPKYEDVIDELYANV